MNHARPPRAYSMLFPYGAAWTVGRRLPPDLSRCMSKLDMHINVKRHGYYVGLALRRLLRLWGPPVPTPKTQELAAPTAFGWPLDAAARPWGKYSLFLVWNILALGFSACPHFHMSYSRVTNGLLVSGRPSGSSTPGPLPNSSHSERACGVHMRIRSTARI